MLQLLIQSILIISENEKCQLPFSADGLTSHLTNYVPGHFRPGTY